MRLFFLLFISLVSYLISYPDMDVRGNRAENTLKLQGKATISLTKNYYKPGDSVSIDFTIKNYGDEAMKIFPTSLTLKSFQFVITDENDEAIEPIDSIKIKDKKLKRRNTVVNLVGDEVKEIIIHKGESFTKRLNLAKYYEFTPGKKYYITGYFYPNYLEDNTNFIKTENNSIFLLEKTKTQIQPKKFDPSESVQEGLTPEEVIHLFLAAEMKNNWKNYFKYIYFPEFIHAYTRFSKEYNKSDETYKELVIDEFKKYLMESKSGRLTYYRITNRKAISGALVKVYVHVERDLNNYPTKYEYIYTLKKGEDTLPGFWKIANVIVKVKR
ncbi:MAG: hypothetical protein KDK36_07140 [Leptospiraceae bacterium]|nr:hypothetical protein [Leptospiraceae bacterium]